MKPKQSLSRRASLKLAGTMTLLPMLERFAWAAPVESSQPIADRRRQCFDRGWRFFRGDGEGFTERMFDDSAWRLLDLPHDWSIEDLAAETPEVNAVIRAIDTAPIWETPKDAPRTIGPFDAGPVLLGASSRSAGARQTGFTAGGIGWYRKRFRLPGIAPDARVELLFDGSYMNTEAWLNGHQLGAHPYGYSPFGFDLAPHLDPAGENVLAVRVANLGSNSRWYSGSGIYRHVWLNVTRALRFAQWGVSISTPMVADGAATVKIDARVEGARPGALLAIEIKDKDGRIVARQQRTAEAESEVSLEIARPSLWSPETPALYQAECSLIADTDAVDHVSVPFGIRQVEIDATRGLRINGKPYKLHGGCIHHDNGLLGAAAIDRAEERKIELLKARGFNAIRTSHNPPAPALLDACDRLGMLVIEEAFDSWRVPKNPDDYHLYFEQWWKRDLAAMVRRDGNHPSVIAWSIGNEIPEQTSEQGVETARLLATELRQLDPTRPITQAINGAVGADVVRADGKPDQAATQFLDLAGYNYKRADYEKDHARFPNRVIVGTESFPSEAAAVWRLMESRPYLIGDFVWTAMDYLGEAAIGISGLAADAFTSRYPWFNAFCGDLDLIGQQKPQSLWRDVIWGVSPLEVAVQRPLPEGKKELVSLWGWRDELQSWTWPGAEDRLLEVSLYTLGDRVELTLNGRKVGENALTETDNATARLQIPYAPGRLVATAFRNGRRIGQKVLETAGAPAALRLNVDRSRIAADGTDLSFATVEIVDAAGRVVPDAVHVLRVSLDGPVRLAAFGNANPRGVASFRQPVAKSWHGRALVILQSTAEAGAALLRVESKGLKPATASLRVSSA